MPAKQANQNVSARELLALIPEQMLTRLARQTGVDYYAKVLYGLLSSEKPSLRALEDVFNSPRFKLLFKLNSTQKIRYNSISERLFTMELSFFEQAYHSVYAIFQERFPKKEAKEYNIVRVDSTMVAETANKLKQRMSVSRKKDGKSSSSTLFAWKIGALRYAGIYRPA